MNQPLVSIITPCYNSELFVADTIQSVLQQTYANWEMIIVDDASTDGSVQIITSFACKDVRIRFYQIKKNSGAGIARNFALEKVKGEYIAFLDSDDLWKPEKLEKQLGWMQQKLLPFTFSFYDCIDEAGNIIQKRVKAPLILSYRQLFFCNYIGNLTGIYSVTHFGKITNNSVRKRQDWMQWLTILKQIKQAEVVPESLAFYRLRENSISASKVNLLKYNFAVYRKFHGYSLLKSMLCMIVFLFTQLLIKPFYIQKLKG